MNRKTVYLAIAVVILMGISSVLGYYFGLSDGVKLQRLPVTETPTPAEPAARIPETSEPAEKPDVNLNPEATTPDNVVTLVITEAEINEQMAMLLPRIDIPEDIPLEPKTSIVDFQPDNDIVVTIESEASLFGAVVNVPIEIQSRIDIIEGMPKLEVSDVNLGSIPLPGVKDTIADMITDSFDDLLMQYVETETAGEENTVIEFTGVTVTEDDMRITMLKQTG